MSFFYDVRHEYLLLNLTRYKIDILLLIYDFFRTKSGDFPVAARLSHFPPLRDTKAFWLIIRPSKALKIREMG